MWIHSSDYDWLSTPTIQAPLSLCAVFARVFSVSPCCLSDNKFIITTDCESDPPFSIYLPLKSHLPSFYKHAGFHASLEQDPQSKHSSSQQKRAQQCGGLEEEEEEKESKRACVCLCVWEGAEQVQKIHATQSHKARY